VRSKTRVGMKPAGMQMVGILGLIQSFRRTSGWAVRLMFGKIDRLSRPPVSQIPMRSVQGTAASHAPGETPVALTTSASSRRRVALPMAG